MVVAGTELEKWYLEGRYRPYSNSMLLDLVADIKAIVPEYVRISRVLRDIPVKFITAGYKDSLRGPGQKKNAGEGYGMPLYPLPGIRAPPRGRVENRGACPEKNGLRSIGR